MTVIAFKDGILACDRCVASGNSEQEADKMFIKEVEGKQIIIITKGSLTKSLVMLSWYLDGAKPEHFNFGKYSAGGAKDDEGGLVIWDGENLIEYEDAPIPIIWKGCPYWAGAWGMDVALGAMFVGANAVDAIRAANHHCAACNFGVNYVDTRSKPYVIQTYSPE